MSSSSGPERECNLDAGTYATEFMVPGLVYTVPSTGWASLNRQAAPGNFHLFPPGGSMSGFSDGTTDAITFLSSVVAPGRCTGSPSTEIPATFDGLVQFLTTNPHIAVTNAGDVSVGGLNGQVMDVAFAGSDECADGTYADVMIGIDPSHGAFGVSPSMNGSRLYLLHAPAGDGTIAISVDDAKNGGSTYGDGEGWFAVAQRVLDSFVITP